MESFITLASLAGMAFAAWAVLKWMMRAGRGNPLGRPPLSPSDLALLEETTARLVADLRAAADECVERITSACEQAMRAASQPAPRALEAEIRSEAVPAALSVPARAPESCQNSKLPGAPPGAEQVWASPGELELMRGLIAMGAGHKRDVGLTAGNRAI
jgi:hypothetical protein